MSGWVSVPGFAKFKYLENYALYGSSVSRSCIARLVNRAMQLPGRLQDLLSAQVSWLYQ